jgi:hypothetical protein
LARKPSANVQQDVSEIFVGTSSGTESWLIEFGPFYAPTVIKLEEPYAAALIAVVDQLAQFPQNSAHLATSFDRCFCITSVCGLAAGLASVHAASPVSHRWPTA